MIEKDYKRNNVKSCRKSEEGKDRLSLKLDAWSIYGYEIL